MPAPIKDDKLKYAKITPFQTGSYSFCQAVLSQIKKITDRHFNDSPQVLF